MNKLSFYSGFLCIVSISFSLHSMLLRKLNHIEKQLVLREIKKHGPESVRNKVNRTQTTKLIQNEKAYEYKILIALNINAEFYEYQIKVDPLTKNIFERIQQIESISGYIPKYIQPKTNSGIPIIPTNFLGCSTRYWWSEKNDHPMLAIHVESNFTNKQELLEIINNYND